MEYDVTVKIPTAGETSVLINGLGTIKNGTTKRVSSEEAANFKNLTGITLKRAKFQEGISVEVVSGTEKERDEVEPVTADSSYEDYSELKVEDLKDIIARRNTGRAEDALIVPENGHKASLVAAIEADDKKGGAS